MNKCFSCWGDFDDKGGTYKSNMCDVCSPPKPFDGFPQVVTVINVCGEKTTRAEIAEIERRRIVPVANPKDPTGYYVGRMGENGKIAEKAPTI